MALRNRRGKWHFRYTLDGKSYSGRTGLAATKRNQAAASAIEHEHWQAIREGRRTRTELVARRFTDAANEYLGWCDSEHRDRPSTARRIRTSFASALLFFDGVMVAAIGAGEIEGYKVYRTAKAEDGKEGVADVTLRHDLHALSGFFQWAQRLGYASENPVRLVKIPSDKDAVRIHVLTAAEEKAYFAAAMADPLLHDISRVLLAQGMRPDELLSASVADVDLDAGTLRIARSKTTAGRRTLTLTAESRSILARRLTAARERLKQNSSTDRVRGCGWLFPGKLLSGARLTPSGLDKKHERACKAAGVEFLLYDFRHSFATRMAQAGCDMPTLAALLGHSNIRIVSRYIHPTAAHQAQAMRTYEAAQIAAQPKEAVQ